MDEKTLNEASAAALLQANLYDVKTLNTVESYVLQQAKQGSYDFETNRYVLQMYLFYPDSIKIHIVGIILMKALMNLPQTDFLACSYLISKKLHGDEPLKTLFKLANLLETAQFKAFWKECEDSRPLLSTVSGFDNSVRSFISSILSSTYQTIPVSVARELLHLPDKADFDTFVAAAGWQKDNDAKMLTFPTVANPQGRDKRTAQIPIEQVAKILGTFSA